MSAADDDPYRMFLVVRRGAFADLATAAPLAGAAAVACVRRFAGDPALEAWRSRPGKVCLRARNPSQWEQVLAEPHALAGDPDEASVLALPPRRRSERGPLLERLQAMASELEPPPAEGAAPPGAATYLLNPAAPMSSGKVLAQVAHAAVMVAEALPAWADAGCPAVVLAPDEAAFAAARDGGSCVAKVEDAGLTEVPPGTVTVVALTPGG